ncbi:unnamed protein product [Gadus morhua 'NCC']
MSPRPPPPSPRGPPRPTSAHLASQPIRELTARRPGVSLFKALPRSAPRLMAVLLCHNSVHIVVHLLSPLITLTCPSFYNQRPLQTSSGAHCVFTSAPTVANQYASVSTPPLPTTSTPSTPIAPTSTPPPPPPPLPPPPPSH